MDALVDHHRADFDLRTLHSALVDLGVLLVEERDEFGTIVSTITLRSEDEPGIQ